MRLVVAVLVIAAAGYYFLRQQTLTPTAVRDSRATVSAEAEIMMQDARTAFKRASLDLPQVFPLQLAEPLSIHISGRNATLAVAAPMALGDFRYAEIWYDVYRRYHGGSYSVCMRIAWKNAGFYQVFPVSDTGWFVPKCPMDSTA